MGARTNTLFALVCLLVLAFFFSTYWGKERFTKLDPDKLEGRTQGKIYEIIPNESMRQSRWGTEIKIISYSIAYSYSVDGSWYTQKDILPMNNITIPFIKKAKEHYQSESFVIRYSIENPQYSLLDIDGLQVW